KPFARLLAFLPRPLLRYIFLIPMAKFRLPPSVLSVRTQILPSVFPVPWSFPPLRRNNLSLSLRHRIFLLPCRYGLFLPCSSPHPLPAYPCSVVLGTFLRWQWSRQHPFLPLRVQKSYMIPLKTG